MITADPIFESELMNGRAPHVPNDYQAPRKSAFAVWKAEDNKEYRCSKCGKTEGKMSKYCPNCEERMGNYHE